jgi:hypothetical protein
MRLHVKFQRVSVALKNWSKAILGNNKILLKAVSQLIGILDVVQDYRQLSELEVRLKRDLKFRLLGLTAVEKLHAKQTSRISSIRASEANSKLFFLQANGRRRKNYIHSLHTTDGTFYSHDDKADKFFDHFSNLFGRPEPRANTFNWRELGFTRHDLQHLEESFTEEEVLATIQEIAADKAPGPDGFIGSFYKHSWEVIKQDLLLALDYSFNRHDQHLDQLNTTHIILLSQKVDAVGLGDFRPINLIHSLVKLISKLLATRLSCGI